MAPVELQVGRFKDSGDIKGYELERVGEENGFAGSSCKMMFLHGVLEWFRDVNVISRGGGKSVK